MSEIITRAAWASIRRRVNELVRRGLPPSEIIKALEILIENIRAMETKK